MTTKFKTPYQKLCDYLPGGVSSPVRAFKDAMRDPLIVAAARGDILEGIEGENYIDFCASWGALILGHSHPILSAKLAEQMQKGTTYGITTMLEYELAKKINKHMPHIEKLRFCSSGTESTMYALRLARGYTNRDYIVKFVGHYHGSADFLLTKAGSGFATHEAMSRGIPSESVKYTLNLPFNDLEALEKLFNLDEYKGKIAAVILEPITMNMGVVHTDKSYMKKLREITEKNGTLLVFDEVVTGFRVGLGGASEYYGVKPDLTCLGKIVGGGLPAAAYGGKKEIMDQLSPIGPIYQAGTLSGNPMAMTSGHFVLSELEKPDFYQNLEAKTNQFLKPIEDRIKSLPVKMCIQKQASMFTFFFGVEKVNNMDDSIASDKKLFWSFFNYLFDRGIYWPPSPFECSFMMLAHSEKSLEYTREVILEFLDQL